MLETFEDQKFRWKKKRSNFLKSKEYVKEWNKAQ